MNQPTVPSRWLSWVLLALAYLGSHTLMIWLAVGPGAAGSTDTNLYAWWVATGEQTGDWVGIEADWVYPVGALIPILAAAIKGTGAAYLPVWCFMVAILNLAAAGIAVRIVSIRRAVLPLTGWFAFLVALGPVGLARLDAVMMPLVLIALLLAAARPAMASALVTLSAWVKVAGGAAIIPLACIQKTWRDRLVRVVLPAAVACAAVMVWQHLAGGTWGTLTSFVRAETGRGLQIEAILATLPVLGHVWRGEVMWRYNDELGTYETWGTGAEVALTVSDLALPAVVVVVGVACWAARHRPTDALLLGTLAMMTGLIVAHKVGSPQFVAWVAPPVVVGLGLRRAPLFWGPIGALLLVAAALTGWLYPWGYFEFLDGKPFALALWVLRNLIVTGVFGASLVALVRRRGASVEQ
ncbi:MAG: hypothetical protein LBE08_09755 [Bifidobacteriaceae bacterium]|jgi:hypothetical protein|nr:hypothetical protein [Bifidobacteriaceae bacterium]